MNEPIIDIPAFMAQTLFMLGNRPISVSMVLAALGVILFVFVVWRLVRASKIKQVQAAREAAAMERAREAETRMAELVASQNELTGRMQTMSEIFSTRQSDMMRTVDNRLEKMGGRIGESMAQTSKNTSESLTKLAERLAVIDKAQSNITELSGQVVELHHILANKQTRGAFGEGRMQTIIADGLPKGSYEFQATLSNSKRPDCLIHMPNDTPPLVVDAKFPMESWNAIRNAQSPGATKQAAGAFKRDVEIHIKAIAEKYLITQETQDTAFMFVPSESVFAEIHENFEGLVQTAHRSRVVIVSPSLLMLSIQVIQSVLKDVRMREQAHLIQGEVMRLMQDVSRLDDRVRKLDQHFGQARKDVEMILTSSEKISRRGTKIADLDFEENAGIEAETAKPHLKAVE